MNLAVVRMQGCHAREVLLWPTVPAGPSDCQLSAHMLLSWSPFAPRGRSEDLGQLPNDSVPTNHLSLTLQTSFVALLGRKSMNSAALSVRVMGLLWWKTSVVHGSKKQTSSDVISLWGLNPLQRMHPDSPHPHYGVPLF